ncbi:MAG TPA: DUF305 domain-containing protein [Gemmatimonadaceae bacterium]|nr:DUF305 domain-containing protein [Gemmatimonadaceae bacterium]
MRLRPSRRPIAASPAFMLLAAFAISTGRASAQSAPASPAPPHNYTQADVDFMQGMIIHHAQAVVMSEWAPTHGASPAVQTVCKRIAISQRDEIRLMQSWLQERHLAAPDPLHMRTKQSGPIHDRSKIGMPGMDMVDYPMIMKGMLTPAQMRQLDAARGMAFDTLYLTGMIGHHEGALDMVAMLFSSPGGGQQPDVSALATDIDAGQRAEIARMQALLNTLTASHAK